MTLDEQRESFWRAIEAEPDNVQYKLEFSDWLEERGEEDLAYCMRWCAGHNRRPEFRLGEYGYSWIWHNNGEGEYLRPTASLPNIVFNELFDNSVEKPGSFKRAFSILAFALSKLLNRGYYCDAIAIPAPKYAEVTE